MTIEQNVRIIVADQNNASYSVPGLPVAEAQALASKLQSRLHALNDLQLTLKHIHWNVVGPKFISVHEMLDPMVEQARAMADEIAERMATMGVEPIGTPGDLVATRTWEDYPIGRAQAAEHLAALDLVFDGVISGHRDVMNEAGKVDAVVEDILIGQIKELEKSQWFVRSHLIDNDGNLASAGADSAKQAAQQGLEVDKALD
ncbi:Dps family protein [Parenemella sanctibonifatiensis]|uniref:DNA starvation/stationary phase protection protein n=1 Tax=Parenemella sanctibonifatiensis TaxID=2016505 RepID=A0A255ECC1_9ACTN|nr:DNA starvation/stationary phase protection protein [Parenemella sanctibonifatiensis]OYN89186.1 DNA starvation/stationary phase protection protein [Parenemella sanctibonifatiensis]